MEWPWLGPVGRLGAVMVQVFCGRQASQIARGARRCSGGRSSELLAVHGILGNARPHGLFEKLFCGAAGERSG